MRFGLFGLRARWSGMPPHFGVIVAITLCMWLGSSIIAPVLPLYAERMGVGATGAGVAVGAYFLGRLSFNIVGGTAADRFGLRTVAVVGCLIAGVGSAAGGLVSSFDMLLAARILQGAGSGLYATAALSAIIALSPPERVGRMVSTYTGVGLAGFTVGPVVGGAIGAAFGLEAPFYAFAALALVASVVAAGRLPGGLKPRDVEKDRGDPPSGPSANLRHLLRGKVFLPILIITFTVYAIRGGVRVSVVPLFADAKLGMSEIGIGVMLAISAVANVAVLAHAGSLLDRRGRRPVIVWSLVASGLSVLAFGAVYNSWLLVAVMIVLAGATGYGAVAPTTAMADIAAPEIRGRAIGIQRVATDLSQMVGPPLAGLAVDGLGYRPGFLVIGAVVLFVVILALRIPETHRYTTATP